MIKITDCSDMTSAVYNKSKQIKLSLYKSLSVMHVIMWLGIGRWLSLYAPCHERTFFLHMQKQR